LLVFLEVNYQNNFNRYQLYFLYIFEMYKAKFLKKAYQGSTSFIRFIGCIILCRSFLYNTSTGIFTTSLHTAYHPPCSNRRFLYFSLSSYTFHSSLRPSYPSTSHHHHLNLFLWLCTSSQYSALPYPPSHYPMMSSCLPPRLLFL